ncbi:hypothetical protein [Candidatus Enterococcus mansonii]|uniref:Lipoprotein n=1 Tax=Candidatus Enterococcus mansonii TaxID=1834181 RepID=A0A242CEB1_9ENTE|nr:hypothetical protein [Enterococcus sp. 4G2_DIV0659]OTO08577.1 hypothetical protein A5880_001577 [Enterococcus sp. 4G2_DIV0659]
MKRIIYIFTVVFAVTSSLSACTPKKDQADNVKEESSQTSKFEVNSSVPLESSTSKENTETSSKKTADKKQTQTEIAGSELDELKQNGETTIGLVVDPKNQDYKLLLDAVKEICEDRSLSYYIIDVTNSDNKAWLNENDVKKDMNIAIIHGKRITLFDLQHKNEYNPVLLGSIVDGIMGKMKETEGN